MHSDILFEKYRSPIKKWQTEAFYQVKTQDTVQSFQLDKLLNCEFSERHKNCLFGSVRSYH